MRKHHWMNGFTLVELLITIAIMAIIVILAVGFYTPFLLKSRRADGINAILNLQLAEERYRSTNSQYGTLVQIGGSSSSQLGYYSLSVSNVSATAYTITATGQGKQSGDTEDGAACSPLTLTVSNGNVTQSPSACWPS
jgi:type IV pilus assembly protein PilE